MILSNEDIKNRLTQKSVRISDLKQVATLAGINLDKARTKAAIQKVMFAKENLAILRSKPDLLPAIVSDSEAIKAEADAKALHIQQLREALDSSIKVNRAMGFTFVALMFYILLIIVGTTDLQLFLPESKIRLPIVEVELPLLGFYSVVPFLILVFHFHLLINLKHHHEHYCDWRKEAGDQAQKARLNPILIILKDTYPNRYNLFRILIVLVVSLSVLYFPLVNLTLMQWRFGDYHDFWISTTQWGATLLDTLLILGFFSKIGLNNPISGRFAILSRVGRRLPLIGISTFGIVFWMLALKLMLMLENKDAMPFLPSSWIPNINLSNSRDRIGEVPDGYVLHYLTDSLDAEEARQKALATFGKRINLDGRDFRFANLFRVNLSKASMLKCKMDFAYLESAILEDADLSAASLQGCVLGRCNLKGATLVFANLEGANLEGAKLEGAHLSLTHMKGADLSNANQVFPNLNIVGLDSADFRVNRFRSTDLVNADLKRANLEKAIFVSADFSLANLVEANLRGSNLKGANLFSTNLGGANLEGANLEGANLRGANLRGANLKGANLEGANLRGANLKGANLKGTILDKSM